jgi:uncharacterized protein Yka (UPF0111/DUF47 family)
MNMAGKSFIQYASIQNLNKPVITFCEKNFTIEFVQNNPMSFVDKLYEKCSNFLRKDEEHAALKTSEKVTKLLINDNLEEAISLLKNAFKTNRDEDLVSEIEGIESGFNRLKRQVSSELISKEDANVKRNNFRVSLRDYVEDIKKIEG